MAQMVERTLVDAAWKEGLLDATTNWGVDKLPSGEELAVLRETFDTLMMPKAASDPQFKVAAPKMVCWMLLWISYMEQDDENI